MKTLNWTLSHRLQHNSSVQYLTYLTSIQPDPFLLHTNASGTQSNPSRRTIRTQRAHVCSMQNPDPRFPWRLKLRRAHLRYSACQPAIAEDGWRIKRCSAAPDDCIRYLRSKTDGGAQRRYQNALPVRPGQLNPFTLQHLCDVLFFLIMTLDFWDQQKCFRLARCV